MCLLLRFVIKLSYVVAKLGLMDRDKGDLLMATVIVNDDKNILIKVMIVAVI